MADAGQGGRRRRRAGIASPDRPQRPDEALRRARRRRQRRACRSSSGEIRAVIGPNGAGKTTLFHLITGVVKPTVGSVRFAGEDITGLPAHAICQRGLSRTFQLTSLFPEMTARENVQAGGAGAQPAALAAVRWRQRVRATREAPATRPSSCSGLEHVASRPAGLLSHGDQRLLEVAMAMAQEPQGAAARRADAGPLGRGDGPGRRDAGAVPGELARDRAAGRARHGGRVPARPQDHGAAPRRRHRRRDAGGGQGRRRACSRPISGASTDAQHPEPQHALWREPRPPGGRPRALPRPHRGRARPQRRRQDHHRQDHHGARPGDLGHSRARRPSHHRLAAPPGRARRRRLRAGRAG